MPRTIIIFDFDGTLVDTMRELVNALVDTFGNHLQGDELRRREQMMDAQTKESATVSRALGLPIATLLRWVQNLVKALPRRIIRAWSPNTSESFWKTRGNRCIGG